MADETTNEEGVFGEQVAIEENKKEAKPIAVHWFKEVTAASVDELMDQILSANEASEGAGVDLYLSSPGGDLGPSIHFLYTIRRAVPALRTFATYEVNSAGIFLFLAGRERFSFPGARFLFHKIRVNAKIRGSTSKEVREMAADLDTSMKKIVNVTAEIMGRTPKEIMKLCRAEKHIGTDKALEIGLIKEVIKP